jgi:hypothetical protein
MINLAQRPRFAPFIKRPPLAAKYRDANDTQDDGFRNDDEAREMADFIKKQYRDAAGIKDLDDGPKSEEAEARLNALSGRPDSDPEKQDAAVALIRAFIPKGRR